jgi:transcription initiation factor TFIIIB Brf1 subunit/transcription initiation factor TFIIB
MEPLYMETNSYRGVFNQPPAWNGEASLFLQDVCSHAEIPRGILDLSLSYFLNIQKRLGCHKPKFGWKELAAYALYETLSKEGASKTKREIGFFTGCQPTRLFDVESALNLEETLENPCDYIGRFCRLLDMSNTETAKIRAELYHWRFLDGVTAQCAAAVAIHWFCVENKKKMSLRRICDSCDVSPANVSSVSRRLKLSNNDHIKMLRLNCE